MLAFPADVGAFAALGGEDVGVASVGVAPAQRLLRKPEYFAEVGCAYARPRAETWRAGGGYRLVIRASVRTVTSSVVVARRSAQACHTMNANPTALIAISEYSSRPVLFTA